MLTKLCSQSLFRTYTQRISYISYHFSFCVTRLSHNRSHCIFKGHVDFNSNSLTHLTDRNLSVQPCFAKRRLSMHMHKNGIHRLPQDIAKCSQERTVSVQRVKHHCMSALVQSLTHTNLSHRAYTTGSNTVKETLVDWTAKLEAADVPEASLAVEHIISHILDVPRSELNKYASVTLTDKLIRDIERLMTCRLMRMPLQYILGEWDFHSVTLRMQPPVFIPRPETEQLVELALECLQGIKRPQVLEIGCGSGAISLSLLHSVDDLQCVAVDQSKHAIDLTKLNASNLEVIDRLSLVQGKVTEEKIPCLPQENFDLIISNPPYVFRKDMLDLEPEIMIYEDLRALDGGKEGLDVVKPILMHCQHFLSDGCTLLLEVDSCHRYLIPAWMEKQSNLKLKIIEVFQDFNGKDRFIKLIKIS